MVLPDFSDVLNGQLSLESAAVVHPNIQSLYFLSAPSFIPVSEIDPEKMRGLLEEARQVFDFCIIDSPAGIGGGFQLASRSADAAVVVSTGDVSSCRDVQRVVMELRALGISEILLIVNRIRPRLFMRAGQTVDDIVDAVGARLLGVVPEDRSVILSANQGTPLLHYSTRGASAAYGRIAGRLLGERITVGDMKPIL
jgi:septum site-determining protein MinD